MNIETIKSVYFVGAGGIGMSALVRYFLFKGKVVAGYDRTPTPLTETLIAEGAQIHYEENIDLIPEACKDKESTLVVFTPAVPQEHEELVYFRNNGFEIQKRAQVLGTTCSTSRTWNVPPSSEESQRTTAPTCCFLKKALTRSLKQTSSTVLSIGYPLICPLSRPQIPTIWIFTVQNRPIWKVSSITQLSFNRAAH